MSTAALTQPSIPSVQIDSHRTHSEVSGTIDFAGGRPSMFVVTLAGALRTTKTVPVTPQERAAAQSLQQALESANIASAGFRRAGVGPVPVGVTRVTVGSIGSYDISIDPSSGEVNPAGLTAAQQGVANLIQNRIVAYFHAANAS